MEHEGLLKIFTLIVGFYMAWNIGANDVSNAMGTSVGSKALTLTKAVFLAAILEFCGSFFLGSAVSETIQKGIIDPQAFSSEPMIFVLGMLGALLATSLWLHLASYLGLPVSTTHAIVGGVLGFGLVIGGIHAVQWTNMLSIFASWVISPLCSGLIAYWIFSFLQNKILFDLNPVSAAKKLTPFFVFIAFTFFCLGLLYQGLGNLHIHISFALACVYASILGAFASFISYFLVKKIPLPSFLPEERPYHVISLEKAAKHLERTHLTARGETQEKAKKILEEIQSLASSIKEKTPLSYASTEYSQVEKIFGYLQILSACLVAFAHGANDVANAIGPVAAVFQTLSNNAIGTSAYVPSWLLAFGGIGIVIGLSTWGWRVIETIGKKITELTPTRGFSAEFGASLTILFASKLGLPISTTHALVGAVLGVGLARGLSALNLKTLKDILLSWVVTIPSCAVLSILCFYVLKALFH